MFTGEGEYEYNLDALTEIEVTDSYLAMDENIRKCQIEPLYNCTTRLYLHTITEKCGCLPLNIRYTDKVSLVF